MAKEYKRVCAICKKEFFSKSWHTLYCSKECFDKNRHGYWIAVYERQKQRKVTENRKSEYMKKEERLTRECIEAKEQKISYGELKKRKYLAGQESIKERIEREKREKENDKQENGTTVEP